MAPKDEYLTPDEVLERYPCLKEDFNWNTGTPGYLHSIGLLHGNYLKGRRMMLISLSSLKALLKFLKDDLQGRQNRLD